MAELQKTLSAWRGAALFINIVLGAGLLVLPGLTVQKIGDLSMISWILCAVLASPLFIIFIILGCRYPGPGGIASYVKQAYGRLAYIIASLMFLGAVLLGLPAIALTGGYYASNTFGGQPHMHALLILGSVLLLNLQSVEAAGKLNQWLSWVLVAFLTGLALLSLFLVSNEPTTHSFAMPSSFSEMKMIWVAVPMIFFAFTGWEVGASITGEFKNPKKDLPLAMWLSFVIAVALYLVMAYVVQRADLGNAYESPFATIINNHLGAYGKNVVGVVAITLIFANLSAAGWGVSRMFYSLAQEGIAPPFLLRLTKGQPYHSLVSIIFIFSLVVILDWLGFMGVDNLLSLAGQNFIILYGLSALVLVKLAERLLEKMIAFLGIFVCMAIVTLQGFSIIYPLIILALSVSTFFLKARQKKARVY
ncbi:APC family permease [Halomonas sp. G11]|uniref:APC family permease n=1 Tax=Halomonas sp. G11 TaxID=1684425 RepID=UPI000801502D|nr:amino acid permease [Halomonas sp. G11]OAZ91566.1 hypothetical protein ADS46_06930 [Halomonas sp. G11]